VRWPRDSALRVHGHRARALGATAVDAGDPVQHVGVARLELLCLAQGREGLPLLLVLLVEAGEVEVERDVLRIARDRLLFGLDLRARRGAAAAAEQLALEQVADPRRAGADAEDHEAAGEHDREQHVDHLRVTPEP